MESEAGNQVPDHISVPLKDALDRVLYAMQVRDEPWMAMTGLRDLDEHTLPAAPALIIVAGRPQMGRSSLLHKLAMAKSNAPLVIYTLDLTAEHVTLRLICAQARFDLVGLRRGYINSKSLTVIGETSAALMNLPISIVDHFDMTLESIHADLSARQAEHRPEMVFIDGLELMGYRRGEEMDEALARLRRMSREFYCSIFVSLPLSYSVESRLNRRPLFSDLTIAPMAEIYADAALFIYRDEFYNIATEHQGVAEIIIAKNKSGPIGTIKVQFHTGHMRFNDLAPEGV